MANRDQYDPYRDDRRTDRQAGEGDGGGWRQGGENRSFGRDDARSGYGQYSREDRPAYGGQGAYGQGRGPGGYGYGAQGEGRGQRGADDYGEGGQGGFGPIGGAYGARGGGVDIQQGQPTYGEDDFSAAARRSESRETGEHHHDPHYRRWHDEQMGAHDRDYARWRDERSRQYHQEYGAWRSQRHDAFSRDFEDWRTQKGQSAVQNVTDGGDGSAKKDED